MDFLKFARVQWDRVAGWACVVVGAIALLLGWSGVADSPITVEQLSYVVSGGLGGIFALGVGAILLLSADLRDEWRKLDAIEKKLGTAPVQFANASLVQPGNGTLVQSINGSATSDLEPIVEPPTANGASAKPSGRRGTGSPPRRAAKVGQ